MLTADAKPNVMLGRRYRGRARPGKDNDDVLDGLLDDLEGVEECRAGDDRRPMLIVVKDRDAHRFAERLLDVETIRGADVLEVDAADRWLEQLAELDDVVGILRADLDVEHVNVRELLEQIAFSLHDWLSGDRADVAEA